MNLAASIIKKRPVLIVLFFLIIPPGDAACQHPDSLAVEYYLKGSFMETRQDYMHAYTYYLYANRYEPENGRILLALARITFDMGKFEETLRYTGKLMELGSYDTNARLLMAEVELRGGNSEKAIELLNDLKTREDAPRFEVYKFLAKIYLDMDDTDNALEAFEGAKELDRHDLYINYRLGFLYADRNEIDKAIESFRDAVDSNPEFSSAHLALASILYNAGRREEAKEAFLNAIALDPENKTAVKDLADIYYEDQEFDEGIALLEPLYLERKLDEQSKITLGRFYYRAGRLDDAVSLFTGLMESTGEKPSLLRVVSEIEMERGRFRTATSYLKKLVEAEPGNFSNYIGLLLVYNDLAGPASSEEETARLSEAEGRFYLKEAVKRVDRNSPRDNYITGIVYRRIGDNERARDFLLRAEELNPGDENTLLELARAFEQLGEYDEALKRVEILYGLNPEDPSIANFYGYLFAEKGENLDFAEDVLKKALVTEPGNGYFLDSLGWIMFMKGEYEAALGFLSEATGLVADDAVMWEHLGDTYIKLKLHLEAEGAYLKSISIDPGRAEVHDKLKNLKEESARAEKN